MGFSQDLTANLSSFGAGLPVSIAGTAINSAIGAATSKRDLKRQLRYQNYFADAQMRRQKELFDYQNAYNSPSAVRERLSKAGFNVNMALDNGGMVSPTSMTSSPSAGASFKPSVYNPRMNPIDSAERVAQINLINSQAENQRSQANYYENKDSRENYSNETHRLLAEANIPFLNAKTKNELWRYGFNDETRELQIELLRLKNRDSLVNIQKSLYELHEILPASARRIRLDGNRISNEISLIQAKTHLTYKQASQAVALAAYFGAMRSKVEFEDTFNRSTGIIRYENLVLTGAKMINDMSYRDFEILQRRYGLWNSGYNTFSGALFNGVKAIARYGITNISSIENFETGVPYTHVGKGLSGLDYYNENRFKK